MGIGNLGMTKLGVRKLRDKQSRNILIVKKTFRDREFGDKEVRDETI